MGQRNELKDFTRGQIDAVLMKIGQDAGMGTVEGVKAFLRGDLVASPPSRLWRKKDDSVCFSVTSDGTTGPQWVERLEKRGFRMMGYAKELLYSDDFQPTSGLKTEIAVLKGDLFADNGNRTIEKIRAAGAARNLKRPNAEVACLIREMFADEEIRAMGLGEILVMHKAIVYPEDGDAALFSVSCHTINDMVGNFLCAWRLAPDFLRNVNDGFAFAVSFSPAKSSAEKQVSTHQ